ncbi:hypothetical protein MLGJGCBP_01221 [Rhodococcus sp. T7]|nr:hypothetical protein MLGJGCBP_01221 [Rhodococcus sp. T7]
MQLVFAAEAAQADGEFVAEPGADRGDPGLVRPGLDADRQPPMPFGVLGEVVEQGGLPDTAKSGEHHAAVIVAALAAGDEQIEFLALLVPAFQGGGPQTGAGFEGVEGGIQIDNYRHLWDMYHKCA